VAAIVAPLALLGWASLPGGYGLRVASLLGLWMIAFLVVGRPDNNYWGFLMAPFLLLGLALAPGALRDLFIAAGRRVSLLHREARSAVAIQSCGSGLPRRSRGSQ
jgi:hypothetical protein